MKFIISFAWIGMYYVTGLMRDDVLYETPDVKEALRRLPREVVDERTFRIIRALQLSGQKKILPKDQWTKYEEASWEFCFYANWQECY